MKPPRSAILRWVLIIVGVFFLLLAPAVLLFGLTALGMNGAEIRRLHTTGKSSIVDRLTWSEWRPNDGSVFAMSGAVPEGELEQPTLPEYRTGYTRDLMFAYRLYEGRFRQGEQWVIRPAYGPQWGAHYHFHWAAGVSFVAAIGCFIAAAKLRASPSERRPLSP